MKRFEKLRTAPPAPAPRYEIKGNTIVELPRPPATERPLIRARVRESNHYGGFDAGEVVEVPASEIKRVPHCLISLEDEAQRQAEAQRKADEKRAADAARRERDDIYPRVRVAGRRGAEALRDALARLKADFDARVEQHKEG